MNTSILQTGAIANIRFEDKMLTLKEKEPTC